MKAHLGLAAMVAVLCVALSSAVAQPEPTITVYFDEALTQRAIDCPGPGLDTLFVVAKDFPEPILGIDLNIDFPPNIIWLADLGTPPVTLGTTATGLSMAWAGPMDASTSLLLFRVLFLWNCVDCSLENQPVEVLANPHTGFLGAVASADFALIPASAASSVVCERLEVAAHMDIRPGGCPNAFNVNIFSFLDDGRPKKGGVLPVALHGSASFDVADVDISSLRLEGVAPLTRGGGPKVDDLGAPKHPACDCTPNPTMSDPYPDLNMKFSSQEIAAAITAGQPGEELELTLTGTLLDGTPLSATDCIRFVGRGAANGQRPMLSSASPNPFNPVTRIGYFMPAQARVRLTIHNVRGEHIATLVDGPRSGGDHIATWDADGFPSGVYFYRLNVGTFSDTRKMVLLK